MATMAPYYGIPGSVYCETITGATAIGPSWSDWIAESRPNDPAAPPQLPDKPLLFVPRTKDILKAHGAYCGRKDRRD
jgi:hypothetical protein